MVTFRETVPCACTGAGPMWMWWLKGRRIELRILARRKDGKADRESLAGFMSMAGWRNGSD